MRAPKPTGLIKSANNNKVVGVFEEYLPVYLQNLSALRDIDLAIGSRRVEEMGISNSVDRLFMA